MGPAGPTAPVAPVSPLAPSSPLGPAGPIGPTAPVAPVAPASSVTLRTHRANRAFGAGGTLRPDSTSCTRFTGLALGTVLAVQASDALETLSTGSAHEPLRAHRTDRTNGASRTPDSATGLAILAGLAPLADDAGLAGCRVRLDSLEIPGRVRRSALLNPDTEAVHAASLILLRPGSRGSRSEDEQCHEADQ